MENTRIGYEMWHDEYRCPDTGAYIHGILLIPVDRKDEVIQYLDALRAEFNYSYSDKRGYGGAMRSERTARFLRSQLALGVYLLSVKQQHPLPLINADGRMVYTQQYTPFLTIPGDNPFNLKLGVLVVPQNHTNMFGQDYSAKVETTLRFALKGLCHLVFDQSNPVEIKKLYFDGTEHHRREFYLERIIGRTEWRDYVLFDPDDVEVDSRHRNERSDESALVMDLVDAMLGGLYNKTYNNRNDHNNALQPLTQVTDRLRDGRVLRQPNSRWYKAATMSEVFLTGDEDCPFDFRSYENRQGPTQGTLNL